mgnify:CR=1 FL=1|jgi:hypothetical protein
MLRNAAQFDQKGGLEVIDEITGKQRQGTLSGSGYTGLDVSTHDNKSTLGAEAKEERKKRAEERRLIN